jgi:hypothetical protein
MRIYSTQNRGRRGNEHMQGRIQDFKLWGAHLKKLRHHDYTPKKSYFLTILGGAPGSAPDMVVE